MAVLGARANTGRPPSEPGRAVFFRKFLRAYYERGDILNDMARGLACLYARYPGRAEAVRETLFQWRRLYHQAQLEALGKPKFLVYDHRDARVPFKEEASYTYLSLTSELARAGAALARVTDKKEFLRMVSACRLVNEVGGRAFREVPTITLRPDRGCFANPGLWIVHAIDDPTTAAPACT